MSISEPRLWNLGEEQARVLRNGGQPFELKLSSNSEHVHKRWRQDREIDRQHAPVGAASIVVGKAIVAAALPRAESWPDRARTFGSCARAATARPTKSGDSDSRKFLSVLPPSRQFASVNPMPCSIDSERRKPGCHGYRSHAVWLQFGRHVQRQTLERELDHLRDRLPPAPRDRSRSPQRSIRGGRASTAVRRVSR